MLKFGLKTLEWCEMFFDVLDRSGVTRECGIQTNGRTDFTIANAAIHYVARPKIECHRLN